MDSMIEREQGTILYGMMGCGKSTLGKILAEELSQQFVDTDGLIEADTGLTCSEIIQDPTRDFAVEQSKTIFDYNPVQAEVVATGGSVASYPKLVKHLANYGIGVFINVDPEVLVNRLAPERVVALNNPDKLSFAKLYEARAELYRQAGSFVLDIEAGESIDRSLEKLIDLREYAGSVAL